MKLCSLFIHSSDFYTCEATTEVARRLGAEATRWWPAVTTVDGSAA
jgi:hypothetical protein